MLKTKKVLKQYAYISMAFLLICAFLLIHNSFFHGSENDKDYSENTNHSFVIYSTFYYNHSKLYADNSMVLLLNTHKDFQTNSVTFQCYSENKTTQLTSDIQIRMGSVSAVDCQWAFFIANCSTVTNPMYFGLTSPNSPKAVEVDFESPIQDKKYPVAMCYPPMVYESRWQQIIFATEIYHYFGTDLQIQYINSAMKEIVDILEVYESKGWVKNEKFAFFDFVSEDVETIGLNPMLEIQARNLPLALTDCLMKYRESSEFIIIADVDDILFPKRETFFDEFSHLKHKHPTASGFMYHRSYAKIDVAKTFDKFSMKNSLKTFQVTEPTFYGKTIYQPKYSETAWIHNPGLNNDSTVTISPEENKMWHVMIEAKKVRKVKNFARFTNEKQDDSDFEKYTVEKEAMEAMEESFVITFANFTNIPKNNNAYTEILYNCFKKHEGWDGSLPCFTPLRCKMPKSVPNFKCKVAQRDYKVRRLSDNVMLYLSKNPYSWKSSDNGCQLLNHN